jgi:hypothetical protein
MMRIRLPTALLAYGLEGPSASSTVDNLNPQGIHLRNPEIRPNKPSHLCATYRPLNGLNSSTSPFAISLDDRYREEYYM